MTRTALATAFADSGLGVRRGVVELAPSTPAWAETFERVAGVLRNTAPACVAAIEHIGSTSVPGLTAKPLLDVAVALRPGTDSADADVDAWLSGLGMLFRGDRDEIRPDRMYGFELEPMVRLANIHVVPVGSPDLSRYLAFRDRLRASPSEREAYAALKLRLATEHPRDRLAYLAGKEAFIVARRGS
ncbi:GrpB family protein [Agromyces archimandritae]|uniref:GrpB family protein n=1 Tax=Agromyces archimandritae TaxID=2781962 RepID=A0A975IMI4_9MICO|nr:GrpB family protein [Agromyces archimandritae]QTX03485.1 GrpB family protein [Agromyces archimandritae]